MDQGGKRKPGRPNDHQRQNRQFRDVKSRMRLDKDQAEVFRREVEKRNRELGEDLGYSGIVDLARELFS